MVLLQHPPATPDQKQIITAVSLQGKGKDMGFGKTAV